MKPSEGSPASGQIVHSLGPWSLRRDDDGSLTWWHSADPSQGTSQPRTGGPRLLVGTSMNGVVAVEAELAAVLARFWETVEVPEDEDVNIEAILQRLPEPYKSDAEEIVDDMRATSTGSQMLEAVVDAAIEGGVEWPEQEMLTLLPEAVLAQFGSIDFSGVSGPCVIVPESNRRAFVEALQQWGYEVVEDEDAVRRAQPAWSG